MRVRTRLIVDFEYDVSGNVYRDRQQVIDAIEQQMERFADDHMTLKSDPARVNLERRIRVYTRDAPTGAMKKMADSLEEEDA